MVIGQAESFAEEQELNRLVEQCESQFRDVETIRLDGEDRDSIGLLQAYGIMHTPAIIVSQDDGAPLGMWQHRLPSFDEIGYVIHGRV